MGLVWIAARLNIGARNDGWVLPFWYHETFVTPAKAGVQHAVSTAL